VQHSCGVAQRKCENSLFSFSLSVGRMINNVCLNVSKEYNRESVEKNIEKTIIKTENYIFLMTTLIIIARNPLRMIIKSWETKKERYMDASRGLQGASQLKCLKKTIFKHLQVRWRCDDKNN
jgi:hypothetical protein